MRVDSGDNLGQYDYWIRPIDESALGTQVNIEIYDAGLGGFTDLIIGEANTRTTYSLFNFSELYAVENRNINPLNATPASQRSVQVFNEVRYQNRWVSVFSTPEESEQGWILRVATDDGNDVNNYRIRLTGPNADKWQIVALNLSFGLIETSFSDRVLMRPLYANSPPQALRILGEEETEVYYIDSFGEKAPTSTRWESWVPRVRDIDNTWGVMTTGSRQRVNNLVIEGANNSIFPVIYDPQLVSSEELPQPTFTITPSLECNVYSIGVDIRGVELDIDRSRWFLDGTMYSGRNITHTFSTFGTVSYEVFIPVRGRSYPRFLRRQGSIHVNQPPVIRLNEYKSIISPAETVTIDASGSFDPDGSTLEFQWFVNDELRSTSPIFTFSSLVSGRYPVRLVVTDNAPNAGCTTTEQRIPLVVNTQPYAEISHPSVISKNVPVEFSIINDQDSEGDELAFTWTGPGISGSNTGRTINILHSEAGSYTLSVLTDDQTGTRNATFTSTTRYKVNAEPVPAFNIPDIIAPGDALALDASPSSDPDGDPLAFEWSISDGRRFTGLQHSLTFQNPGDYQITLLADDGEGVENSRQSLTKTIRINNPPVAVIDAASIVHDAFVEFSASRSTDTDQGIQRFSWDFGDGSTAEGETVRHLYQRTGSYTITLRVDDGTNLGNSVQSATHQLTIIPSPVAQISAPAMVAPGQIFQLDGQSSINMPDSANYTFEWYMNGVKVGDRSRVSTQISEPGIHEIMLLVKDRSGFDDSYGITTQTIRVNHPPVPEWAIIPPVSEPGKNTVFDASGSFDLDNSSLNFRWVFGDGAELTGTRVTRSFETPGTFSFTLFADDSEGMENSVIASEGEIRVNQSPIIVMPTEIRTNKLEVPLDATGSYDADGGRLTFTWVLPDGSKRHEPSFTWKAPGFGSHRIALLVDDNEGLENSVASQPIQVIINRPPVAIVDALVEACSGQIIIFSSSRSYDPDGDIFTTHWDFGDGNTSRDSNPYHTYTEPGIYTVTLTLNDGLAPEPTVAIIPVKIEGSPQAIIDVKEITVCANTPVSFDGSLSVDPNGQIGAYSWDFGDGSTGLGPRMTHLYSSSGSYDVVLTVIGSGTGTCSNMSQATARVTVIEGPNVEFDIPRVISPGQTVQLDGSSSTFEGNVESAKWTITKNGEPFSELEGITNSFRPNEPGSYLVRFTLCTDISGECNTASKEITMQVNAPPVLAWNVPDSLSQYQLFILSAEGSSDADGYLAEIEWSVNGTSIGKGLSAVMPTLESGVQTVTLTLKDNSNVANSVVTRSKQVFVNSSPAVSFVLPEIVYLGEEIPLVPSETADADGHPLRSEWIVNGTPFTQSSLLADATRYEIKLVQDDGKNMPNSVRSSVKVINVVMPPEIRPTVPAKISRNSTLSSSQIGLSENFTLLSGNMPVEEWAPLGTGVRYVNYGWKPRGTVLRQYNVPVLVYDELAFLEQEVRREVNWNPANPFVRVDAPEINRTDDDQYTLTWTYEDGTLLGHGKSIQLRVRNGENRFWLTARDQNIHGSQPVRIPVIITTLNRQ